MKEQAGLGERGLGPDKTSVSRIEPERNTTAWPPSMILKSASQPSCSIRLNSRVANQSGWSVRLNTRNVRSATRDRPGANTHAQHVLSGRRAVVSEARDRIFGTFRCVVEAIIRTDSIQGKRSRGEPRRTSRRIRPRPQVSDTRHSDRHASSVRVPAPAPEFDEPALTVVARPRRLRLSRRIRASKEGFMDLIVRTRFPRAHQGLESSAITRSRICLA